MRAPDESAWWTDEQCAAWVDSVWQPGRRRTRIRFRFEPFAGPSLNSRLLTLPAATRCARRVAGTVRKVVA